MKIRLSLKKVGISFVAGCLMLLVAGVPANAHTTIEPAEGIAGSYGIYSFKVPNESDTASTIKLEVQFPEEHPLTYVGVTDQDGWNVSVEKGTPSKKLESHGKEVTEVVKKITWDGGKISPGKYAVFHVYLNLPEDADQLIFKAIQTYDDGKISRWIDEPTNGGEEPESPAPVLTITEGSGDHQDSTTAESKTAESKDGTTVKSSKGDSSDLIGIVGIGIGAVALLVAIGAVLKGKR